MDWNAEDVRERTKLVREAKIEIEKERIKNLIEKRVDDGEYCCKVNYNFDEIIDWLGGLGFIIQYNKGEIVISWSPERVDNSLNNPYA